MSDRRRHPRDGRRADRQVRAAEAHHLGRRPAEDALGKIMRRLLRDIAEGRALGDVTSCATRT